MDIERLKDIPKDPSIEAQAEIEQRLMESGLQFNVTRELDGSFAIEIENDRTYAAREILGGLKLEQDSRGDRPYPWLIDLRLISSSLTRTKSVFYYCAEKD